MGTRMTTLAFLLLNLSPLLVFKFDFLPALQFEYLHNILMILSRNVEQDDNSGGVGGGEGTLFFSKKPFLVYFKIGMIIDIGPKFYSALSPPYDL